MRSKLYGPVPAAALPAALAVAVNTELAVLNPVPTQAGTQIPLLVTIPSGSILDGRPFELLAGGVIVTGAVSTVTAKLYAVPSAVVAAGTSGTLGNDTLVASSGAVNQNTATAPFILRASAIFDSTSGKLTGSAKFLINNTLVAEAAFSTVLTGLSGANDPILGFLLTFTLSGANGSITVNQFDVDF
jgi:hypothetical protein